jgi:hypothetical protein
MAFYMHISGKRGRPTRFEERDHAVITAVVMMLDARHRVRGRHPDRTSLVINTESESTVIVDSLTNTTITVVDSVKVKDAHKNKTVTVKSVRVPATKVTTTLAPRKFLGRAVDVSKFKAKIDMITKEAESKGIDVTTNH